MTSAAARVLRQASQAKTPAPAQMKAKDAARAAVNASPCRIPMAKPMVGVMNCRNPVAESGIRTVDDMKRLRSHGIHIALVGESLMREPDPGAALRALLA